MIEALALGLLALVVAALGAATLLRRRPAPPSRPVETPDLPPGRAAGADRPPKPADRPGGGGRIEGKVRASSKRTVGDIVEQHPAETISVLRRWIRSDDR